MIALGWRWMFIAMGIVGIVVAAVWFLVYRDAAETPFDEEERHI